MAAETYEISATLICFCKEHTLKTLALCAAQRSSVSKSVKPLALSSPMRGYFNHRQPPGVLTSIHGL